MYMHLVGVLFLISELHVSFMYETLSDMVYVNVKPHNLHVDMQYHTETCMYVWLSFGLIFDIESERSL